MIFVLTTINILIFHKTANETNLPKCLFFTITHYSILKFTLLLKLYTVLGYYICILQYKK